MRPFARGRATRSVAQNEARKRRASERPHVGCCEELASCPYVRRLIRHLMVASGFPNYAHRFQGFRKEADSHEQYSEEQRTQEHNVAAS